jgi:hypothetical protein
MIVLPGQSQENQPNPPAVHLYFTGFTGFSHLSLSQLWTNGRLCWVGTQTVRMEETFQLYDDETVQIGHM